MTAETTRALAGLAKGEGTENVSSAVGIVDVDLGRLPAVDQDFLAVVGLVSLALALLNLLPVLPLDGGHIVMARPRARSAAARSRSSPTCATAPSGSTLFALLLYFGLRNDLFSGGS